MNSELSLAMVIFMPSGNSPRTSGSAAFSPSEISSGLAVACRTRPRDTAERPLKRTMLRTSAAPTSAWPTSARRSR
ncbi:hypothetical protein D3C84_880250 [compost metagenome]